MVVRDNLWKRKCQPTDVVTAFIAVIILWPFLSEIAKICVFFAWKVREMFVRGSLWVRVLLLKSFIYAFRQDEANKWWFFMEAITPTSWFGCTSGRHCIMYDLLQFALSTGDPATLSLPLIPEDRLRGLESLRLSSQSFSYWVTYSWQCVEKQDNSGLQKQCLFLFTESSLGATVFVLPVWTPLWASTCIGEGNPYGLCPWMLKTPDLNK